jgi:hypothetical protein
MALTSGAPRPVKQLRLPIAPGHAAAISLTIFVVRIFHAALSLRGLQVLSARAMLQSRTLQVLLPRSRQMIF